MIIESALKVGWKGQGLVEGDNVYFGNKFPSNCVVYDQEESNLIYIGGKYFLQKGEL